MSVPDRAARVAWGRGSRVADLGFAGRGARSATLPTLALGKGGRGAFLGPTNADRPKLYCAAERVCQPGLSQGQVSLGRDQRDGRGLEQARAGPCRTRICLELSSWHTASARSRRRGRGPATQIRQSRLPPGVRRPAAAGCGRLGPGFGQAGSAALKPDH